MTFTLAGRTVWVAGGNGMVGSALARRLGGEGCTVVTVGRAELDLTRQRDAEDWIASKRPEAVFLAAAKVGGIHANATYPAEFLYDNLMIEANVIHAARSAGVEKLMLLGSSCIYPRDAAQPMAEAALLTGPLELTNEWYACAKIAGIKLCQAYRRQYGADFISVVPTNLYGPGDNFHPDNSHAPAALLDRFHTAAQRGLDEVVVWGSGTPKREFMHVDDLADACVFLMKTYSDEEPVNIGTGEEISIGDFAGLIAGVVGYTGRIVFDRTRPDGTPRKALDVTLLKGLGWTSRIALADGLAGYYHWYLDNIEALRT